MRKKIIMVYFEFFKNQDPEMLERLFREQQKRKRFPAFRKCVVMVHYKNLKQRRNLKEDFPLMVDKHDIEKKDIP